MKTSKEIAVSVKDIHKEFILPQSKNSSFKQTFVNIVKKNGKVTQKVLDGVSFDVQKGDFFAIVGRNGSGKSTLLKLLAGVYVPTAGEVQINGKLTPFIELGVGFNPELSGRDNVFLNGALLGFDRKQMAEMYDEIVEFAELEPFMDQKLKNYSSGMQVRLAFSIAIKAKNEVLIFDEVLAVGDEAFQRKCLDVFEQYKAEGQTVILVTHDMSQVRRFCNRAVLINQGKVVKIGSPREVAALYSELNDEGIEKELSKGTNVSGSTVQLRILNGRGEPTTIFRTGDKLVIEASWKDLDPLESVGINIFKKSGEHITGHNSRFSKKVAKVQKTGTLTVEYSLNLSPGSYFAYSEAFHKEGVSYPQKFSGPSFVIKGSDEITWSGLQDLPHEWRS